MTEVGAQALPSWERREGLDLLGTFDVPEDFVRAPKAGSSKASTPDFDKSVGSQLWQKSYASASTSASSVEAFKPASRHRAEEKEDKDLSYDFLFQWSREFDEQPKKEKAAAPAPAAVPAPSKKPLPPDHPMVVRRDVTTLMVKNLPNRMRVDQLVEKMNELGFAQRCDYVYMPMDWQTHANKGFAFANFVTAEDAMDFAEKIEGNNLFGVSGSGKRMTTSPACRQGVVENLRSVSYTCRKDKVNFPYVLFGDQLIGIRPPDALERLKRQAAK
jgi:hypothetical protein